MGFWSIVGWLIVVWLLRRAWRRLELSWRDVVFPMDRISPQNCRVEGAPSAGTTADVLGFDIHSYSWLNRRLWSGGRRFEVLIEPKSPNLFHHHQSGESHDLDKLRRKPATAFPSRQRWPFRLGRVASQVKDKGDGTYRVEFDLPTHGHYQVSVRCRGELIQGSPFLVAVVPEPMTVTLEKEALVAGEEVAIKVRPRRSLPLSKRKRINALAESFVLKVNDVPCPLASNPNTTMPEFCLEGTAQVTTSGENAVTLWLDDQLLDSCSIIVFPSDPVPETSVMEITNNLIDNRVFVIPARLKTKSPIITIKILTKDTHGNLSLAPLSALQVDIYDDMKRPVSYSSTSLNEFHEFNFNVPDCGIYTIHCKLHGVEIRDSPLQLYVLSELESQMFSLYKVSGKATFRAVIMDGQQSISASIRLSLKSLLICTTYLYIFSREYHRFLLSAPGFKATLVERGMLEIVGIRNTVRVKLPQYCLLLLTLSQFTDQEAVTLAKKVEWFAKQLSKLKKPTQSRVKVKVSRDRLLQDTVTCIKSYSPEEFRNRNIKVTFKREEGIDMGGLTKEWFDKIATEMGTKKIKGHLLFHSPGDNNLYQPSPFSDQVPDHSAVFRMLGRIVAKSIWESTLGNPVPMSIHFTPSFYKQLLDIPISLQDIETVDPLLFRNRIQLIRDNDIATVKDILMDDIRFCETLTEPQGTAKRSYNLKFLGSNVLVTDQTKEEYLTLLVNYLLKESISSQIAEFKKGFFEIIPEEYFSVFDWNELELLICGMPDIDVAELEANTVFTGGWNLRLKQAFFKAIRAFTPEQRTRFLQFVTGSSSLPVGGFKVLSPLLTINFVDSMDPEMLPRSHTCFNTLDLPRYPTSELLHEKLLLAVTEAFEGFEMG